METIKKYQVKDRRKLVDVANCMGRSIIIFKDAFVEPLIPANCVSYFEPDSMSHPRFMARYGDITSEACEANIPIYLVGLSQSQDSVIVSAFVGYRSHHSHISLHNKKFPEAFQRAFRIPASDQETKIVGILAKLIKGHKLPKRTTRSYRIDVEHLYMLCRRYKIPVQKRDDISDLLDMTPKVSIPPKKCQSPAAK